MIHIDFQGGSHGNFLEFVCNKFLAKVDVGNASPFGKLGSAHKKEYKGTKKFLSQHYFEYKGQKTNLTNSKIICIRIDADDLLPLTSISLLRAGDFNFDNNLLEFNTYNKLNTIHYRWVLNNIAQSYFRDNRVSGYQAVKDSSWPDVETIEQFENLPAAILEECSNVHQLVKPEFSSRSPDCPRYILREFFKIGFKNPAQQGFMTQQQKMVYDDSNQVLIVPFNCFYNLDKFTAQLHKIAAWSDYEFEPTPDFVALHQEFLSRQPYKDIKSKCDQLITKIINRTATELPELTLLEESYIEACLELQYNIELPFGTDAWFPNIQSLYKQLES